MEIDDPEVALALDHFIEGSVESEFVFSPSINGENRIIGFEPDEIQRNVFERNT